jgi:hypothetical protein
MTPPKIAFFYKKTCTSVLGVIFVKLKLPPHDKSKQGKKTVLEQNK